MEHTILATANFVATAPNGEKYNVTLTLEPFGGFAYGNGHGVALNRHAGSGVEWFDARYDPRFINESTFDEYALEFVAEHFREDFIIERVN